LSFWETNKVLKKTFQLYQDCQVGFSEVVVAEDVLADGADPVLALAGHRVVVARVVPAVIKVGVGP
jgi:hypothetical protein